MTARSIALDLAIGLAAGYIATKVTDQAQRVLWHATPECEKVREPDAPYGSSAMAAAHRAAELANAAPDKDEMRSLKNSIHYGLGAGWGLLYPLLRRRCRMSPAPSGILTGTSLSLIVDEALCPALGLTPPSHLYPMSAHARGLLTHLVYGFMVAVVGEALHRATRQHWEKPAA